MLWVPPEAARRLRLLAYLALVLGIGGLITGAWLHLVGPAVAGAVGQGVVGWGVRLGVAALFATPVVLLAWAFVHYAMRELGGPR